MVTDNSYTTLSDLVAERNRELGINPPSESQVLSESLLRIMEGARFAPVGPNPLLAPTNPDRHQQRFYFDLDSNGLVPNQSTTSQSQTSGSTSTPAQVVFPRVDIPSQPEVDSTPKPQTSTPQPRRNNGGFLDQYEGSIGRKIGDVVNRGGYIDPVGVFTNSLNKTKDLLFEHDGSDPEGKKPWLKSGYAVKLAKGAKRRIASYLALGALGAAAVVGGYHQLTKPKTIVEPAPIVQDAYATLPGDDISDKLLDKPQIKKGDVTLDDGTVVSGYHVNLDEDKEPEQFLVDKKYIKSSEKASEKKSETVTEDKTLDSKVSGFSLGEDFTNYNYAFPVLSFSLPDDAIYSTFSFGEVLNADSPVFDNTVDTLVSTGANDPSNMYIFPVDEKTSSMYSLGVPELKYVDFLNPQLNWGPMKESITVLPADPIVDTVQTPVGPNNITTDYLRQVSNSYNASARNFSPDGVTEVLNPRIDVENLPTDQYKNAGSALMSGLSHLEKVYEPSLFTGATVSNAQTIASDLGMSVDAVNKMYSFDRAFDVRLNGGEK